MSDQAFLSNNGFLSDEGTCVTTNSSLVRKATGKTQTRVSHAMWRICQKAGRKRVRQTFLTS